ncbi:DNA methyltransferase [Lactobacillus sp. ESL0731]|uniref:TRM11 family SAM-dependent methyltransferase n=1 Tax=unclassified Lactobacillus TaxID=2620435 RepID=UPI0023F78B6B|nr:MULTISPECIES: DNA methyltransferase [unclassified Lactobacillus]WEV51602.1 DNA methyltransferase [Lactobacillus sp. ESL0700]WEV62731.1 DNA methyltransferase [Lactobacillus sp. ESL0731]
MNDLKFYPENFNLEKTSIWSFPDHGYWATHNSKYRGNFSPYIPRNIILRYSKENDIVLDQFLGGGTTLIEAKLLNRIGIGIDINPTAIDISKKKLNFLTQKHTKSYLGIGNATNLNFIPDNSIDLICTHPPYANIIKYSQNQKDDLSLLTYEKFLLKMDQVAKESHRVLKNNKYCAILIGDIRKNGYVKPLGLEILQIFLSNKFKLKEIVIKEQFNMKGTQKWKQAKNLDFLLLQHEYLFVFKKY